MNWVGCALVLSLLLPGCAKDAAPQKAAAPPQPPPSEPSPHAALIQQALPLFAAAAERQWPAPTQGMAALNLAMSQGRMQRARKLVGQELSLHPGSAEASFAAGVLYFMGGAYGGARQRFERELERGPAFVEPHRVFHFYGACLLRLGEGSLARQALVAHLSLRPGDPHTLYYLGQLALQEGQAPQALTRFQQALLEFERRSTAAGGQPDPSLAKVHAGLGNAHLQNGDLDAADQAMRRSLALDPSQADVHYAHWRVLLRLGDRNAAASAMESFERLKSGLGGGPLQPNQNPVTPPFVNHR